MNAEGFCVPGPLVLNSSFCSSRLLRKDFRIRNTTSPVTTRSPTPSPAVIIQRCCVLFPACSVPNMISAFSFPREFLRSQLSVILCLLFPFSTLDFQLLTFFSNQRCP